MRSRHTAALLRHRKAVGLLLAAALAMALSVVNPAYAATWSGSVTIAAKPVSTNVNAPTSTVTATISANLVGGYWVSIWDAVGNRVLCSSSTTTRTFTVNIGTASDTTQTYRAYVATSCGSGSLAPSPYAARSAAVNIVNAGWTGTITGFTAGPATVDVTNPASTLTVTVSQPVLSPYSVSIYDNTGYRYMCTNSTTLTSFSVGVTGIPVNGSLTFTAYVSSAPCAYTPPTTGIRQTRTVTINNAGWTGSVSLAATPATTDANNPVTTLNATLTKPVNGPYWLSIFDSTGARLACTQPGSTATTYSLNLGTANAATTTYTAYVAQSCGTTTAPPTTANDIRSSATSVVTNAGWTGTVLLTAAPPYVDAFNSVTHLSAAMTKTLAGPYYLSIFDDTGYRWLCARDVTALSYGLDIAIPTDSRSVLTAYVAGDCGLQGTLPTNDVRSTSAVAVANAGWTGDVRITPSKQTVAGGAPLVTMTVTLSRALVAPFSLAIYGPNANRISCQSAPALTSTFNVTVPALADDTYQALVTSNCGTSGAPPGDRDVDAGDQTTVHNLGWNGRLTFDPPTGTGPSYALNAVLDSSLMSPFQISIWDDTGTQVACSTTDASSLGVSVTPPANGKRTYTAYVAPGCGSGGPPSSNVRQMKAVVVTNGAPTGELVAGMDLAAVSSALATREAVIGRQALCAEIEAAPLGSHEAGSSVTDQGLAITGPCESGLAWSTVLKIGLATTAVGAASWLAWVNRDAGNQVVAPPVCPNAPGCVKVEPQVPTTPGLDTSPNSDYVEKVAQRIQVLSGLEDADKARIAARQCIEAEDRMIAVGIAFPAGVTRPCLDMRIWMPGAEVGIYDQELTASATLPWNKYATANVHMFSALTGYPYPDGNISPKGPQPAWFLQQYRPRPLFPGGKSWYDTLGNPCAARNALSPEDRSLVQCDEFPMAAMKAASPAVSSTRPVVRTSNLAGGQSYQAFLNKCIHPLGLAKTEESFLVIPMVATGSPTSQYVCPT